MRENANAIKLSTVISVILCLFVLTLNFQGISPSKINVKTNTIPDGSMIRITSNQTAIDLSNQTSRVSTGSMFLSTNGTQVVDENGSVVILRGVNLSGYEYVGPIQWAHHDSDYATIASWGFNVVRLPISWENLESHEGFYNDAYLQTTVDKDIAWAKQYHIYLILDMHQICWSSHFTSCNGDYSAGLPKWAVSGYVNDHNGIQQMIHDFFSGWGPNGTLASPSNPSIEQRFFAAWQHVASRYRNETTVAGYDILNEPSQDYDKVDSTFTALVVPSFYTDAIDAIRKVDPFHICFWEEPTSVSIQRSNLVYSPHYPQGSLSKYGGTDAYTSRIEQIVSLSRKWSVPLFVGEWGMNADAPDIVKYIGDSLSLYDEYSIGAAWWDYARGSFTMDLFDSRGNPRQILIQNLVRPFVRQVSTPTIFSTTFEEHNQSFLIRETTRPLQIAISVPRWYSVANIQINAGISVNWIFSLEERTLFLVLPVSVSEITVQYVTQLT